MNKLKKRIYFFWHHILLSFVNSIRKSYVNSIRYYASIGIKKMNMKMYEKKAQRLNPTRWCLPDINVTIESYFRYELKTYFVMAPCTLFSPNILELVVLNNYFRRLLASITVTLANMKQKILFVSLILILYYKINCFLFVCFSPHSPFRSMLFRTIAYGGLY